MVWWGRLTPAEYTDTYEVVLDHQVDKSPLVYVARPRLQLVDGKRLPHVYSLNTLCLYFGEDREWQWSDPIANTIVPWASEWLLFYELWLATKGDWLGGGLHPPRGADGNRRQRRSAKKRKVRKLRRLRSMVRLAYGETADLAELLYNAKLQPPSDGARTTAG